MTKAEIVERVADKTDFPKKEPIEMVGLLFDTMQSTLETGEKRKTTGFNAIMNA